MERSAVVLLSGGMDSATCLALAKSEGLRLFALSFSYGQRHSLELGAAAKLAAKMGVIAHEVYDVNPRFFAGSALTDGAEVPKGKGLVDGIPPTYVPARNTVFLAIGTAWAESLGASAVFIGVNALDYSGYPDCRPEFIESFQHVVAMGTRGGAEGAPIEIRAPLVRLTKAEIVRLGIELGVDFSLTISCYDPVLGMACGDCDACVLRRKGFEEAAVADPTLYAP